MYSKLQYISQGNDKKEQLKNIQSVLDAGCDWIQLRFKNGKIEEVTSLAKELKKLCTNYKATLVINDYPHIASLVDADGVHVGLSDMSIPDVKKIIGHNKIVGGSADTLQDVLQRVEEGCSYVGLGPFRFTSTKEKLSPILGIEGYKAIMKELGQREISIPVYAIGGIGLEDISELMQTRVYGIAVSGLITNHADKKLVIKHFNSLLYETVNNSQ